MNRIKKILVAIDFSEPSMNALETAVCIAEKDKAELIIIHVQETAFNFIDTNPHTSSIINNYTHILAALAHDINRKNGIKTVVIEEKGHVAESIVRIAVDQQAGLIVIGQYGASGYRSGHIGTNAYTIVKYAPSPVLLIPAGIKFHSFKKPLLPLRPLVTALRDYELIRTFLSPHAVLDILAITASGQYSSLDNLNGLIEEIRKKLITDKVTATAQINRENLVPESVLDYADKQRSDLIVLSPATDVSTKNFYVGPNTHRILQHTKIPVLILNKAKVHTQVRVL